MGRNTTAEPIIQHETWTPPPAPDPARPVAGAFPTESKVRILAQAIERYLDWQERQIKLRESRRAERTKREAAA
jgi:hypothetical protein